MPPAALRNLIEPRQRQLGRILWQRGLIVARRKQFGAAMSGGTAEYNEIDQRIGAEAVGAVHRHAGRFAQRHQARNHRIIGAIFLGQRFAVIIRGDAAHVVMHGRQYRDRFARHVDVGENARGFTDAGQPLVQHCRVEMIEVQEKVILFLANPAAFADFHGHRARDHIA